MIAAVRVALSIMMFGYASYRDVKTREVSDLVWIIFGALGVALDAYEVYVGALDIVQLLAAVGFMVVFALLVGYLGLFGEADLLAFVVVGLLNPATPTLGYQPVLFNPFFFPLSVISNAVLIGASGAAVVLLHNLSNRRSPPFDGYTNVSPSTRIVLLFTGVRRRLDSIRGPPYEYPLEKVGDDGTLSLVVRPDIGDDEGASKTLIRLREMGRHTAWVSYSLPFLLILGVGYLSVIVFGDIALWLVSHFIH
jgi:preflagellin peptidase FlaK